MSDKSDESLGNLGKLEDLKRRREKILQMGGPKAIEERHKQGQMSARERIDYFLAPSLK